MIDKDDGYTYLEEDDIVREDDECKKHCGPWFPIRGTHMDIWIGDLLPPDTIMRRKSE